MSVLAAIQYTQGATTAPAGQALLGVVGSNVVVNNGDDSNVAEWQWEWIDTPPGSAVLVGPAGGAPTIDFDPDVTGSYQLKLRVTGNDGTIAEDVRCFGVPEIPSGRLIPPFTGDSDSMNFAGTQLGWSPVMRPWLQRVDQLAQDYTATSVNGADADFTAGPTSYELKGAPGTAYLFRIEVVAGQTAPTGAGTPARWIFEVLAHIDSGGTDWVVDDQSVTSFLNGHPWTVVVDEVGDRLTLVLTGQAGRTVRGTARVTLLAVANSSA